MMLMAHDSLGVALAGSWIVGDRAIDVRAGRNAGLAGATHVRTGHGARPNERETALALATPQFAVHAAESIAALLADPVPFGGALAQRR
jgi:D-glycero-D-manno-heptose 1,7-bisphosphate phosphatase